jgi:hypothetical protein
MPNNRALVVTYLFAFSTVGQLAAAEEDRGVIFYERFLGSTNTLGNVFRLDTTVGYSFNKHFSVDGGLPLFFVRPSGTATALAGVADTNGIGNAYLELRFVAPNPAISYSCALTGTAPTGDKSRGLSTGRATVDWTNRFDRSFSQLTPFGAIGFANTVSDTPLFVRPYTTLGFVTHLEGGALYRVVRFLDIGAGAYAIVPSGQQTIVSELVTKSTSTTAGSGKKNSGRGGNQGAFETTSVAVGSADLVRDHGLSVWGSTHLSKALTLQVGYTRSIHYALNTLSFGIGVNLGSVVKSMTSY